MIRGSDLLFFKKNNIHLQLLQLLLVVGFSERRPVDFFQNNLLTQVYSSGSLTGTREALQLTQPEFFPGLSYSQYIHPKAVNVYLDEISDRSRLLARQALGRHFVAYLAENDSPSRIKLSSNGSTALDEHPQNESLSREDADLIEILWKQDVDLGIPYDAYIPTAPNFPDRSVPLRKDAELFNYPKNEYKEVETGGNINTPFIDSNTGEPIFVPLAGPSSSPCLIEVDTATRSLPQPAAYQYGPSVYPDLNSVIGEDLLCSDTDWSRGTNCLNPLTAAVSSSASYNDTDPFDGALIQNASLPNTFDFSAANRTESTYLNTTSGDPSNQSRNTLDPSKSTVNDHQAIRDFLTFNTSTANSNWELFDSYYEVFDTLSSSTAFPAESNTENSPCKVSEKREHPPLTRKKSRRVSSKSTNSGSYAASDTGVSSMGSDDRNEEWPENSDDTSRDQPAIETNYHSNSSSSHGSLDGADAIPQKKYSFFGRKSSHEDMTAFLSTNHGAVPSNRHSSQNSDIVNGLVHNHTYGQSNDFDTNYNMLCDIKSDQYSDSREKEYDETPSHLDGYSSSDPSEVGGLSAQVTSARDERRARDLNIPIPTEEIVTLSIDEFNERLASIVLSEEQHALIRDIRRRGKNKVAAQNCRKRKLDQISALQGEVDQLQDNCSALEVEHNVLSRREGYAHQRLRHLRDLFASARTGAIPKQHPVKL